MGSLIPFKQSFRILILPTAIYIVTQMAFTN